MATEYPKVEDMIEAELAALEEAEVDPNLCFDCQNCCIAGDGAGISKTVKLDIYEEIGFCLQRERFVSAVDTDQSMRCEFFEEY